MSARPVWYWLWIFWSPMDPAVTVSLIQYIILSYALYICLLSTKPSSILFRVCMASDGQVSTNVLLSTKSSSLVLCLALKNHPLCLMISLLGAGHFNLLPILRSLSHRIFHLVLPSVCVACLTQWSMRWTVLIIIVQLGWKSYTNLWFLIEDAGLNQVAVSHQYGRVCFLVEVPNEKSSSIMIGL